MGGPVKRDPTPDWVRDPSVMDPAWKRTVARAMKFLGLDTPEGQVLAVLNPMEVGPVGGLVGAAQKGMRRLAELVPGLDMSTAARMQRAAEMGFNQDVYHGTQAKWSWMDDPAQVERMNQGLDVVGPTTDALHEFRANRGGGLKMMDGMGTHAGTAEAANQRLESNVGAKFGTPEKPVDPGKLHDAYVMPLKGRAARPFTKTDGRPFTESELQSRLSAIAKKLGYTDTRAYSSHYGASAKMKEAQRAVKQHLQELGYDSIPYVNSHEDRGSISWVFFEPNQLRSTSAAFDPAKRGSASLLAGLGGAGVLLSDLAKSPNEAR